MNSKMSLHSETTDCYCLRKKTLAMMTRNSTTPRIPGLMASCWKMSFDQVTILTIRSIRWWMRRWTLTALEKKSLNCFEKIGC